MLKTDMITRILRVNHAGEVGAIRIYKAQLLFIKLFHKDLLCDFQSILAHEKNHCLAFRDAMTRRLITPCHTLWIWTAGGYLLGFLTALLGRNAIMVCTEIVEKTVHTHMNEQIAFLAGKDEDLKNLIKKIAEEEVTHLSYAERRVRHHSGTSILRSIIRASTQVMIWLSTQGAPTGFQKSLQQ